MLAAKYSSSRLVRVVMHLLRFFGIGVGAYFAGVYPADIWVNERRAANLAAHHMPNMDPGVVVVIALLLTMPIIVALFVCELARIFGFNGEPLSLPVAAMLGGVAAWPVGYSIWADTSNVFIFLTSAIGVIAFYYARRIWMARAIGTRQPDQI